MGYSLANHPNDQAEIGPSLASIPIELGPVAAVALDNGYFSAANVTLLTQAGIEAYLATGPCWLARSSKLAEQGPAEPGEQASPQEKMAYTKYGKVLVISSEVEKSRPVGLRHGYSPTTRRFFTAFRMTKVESLPVLGIIFTNGPVKVRAFLRA